MSSVLLIRPAQSTWNATGRWQGQADPPLSAAGEELARQAAVRLAADTDVELVITSDLQRARRTGEILAGRVGVARSGRQAPELVAEPGLREFHVGEWSGLTRMEIEERWPSLLASFDAGRLTAAPGGETRSEFDARVRHAAERVARAIDRHRAGCTLVVTHGGVIRSLARTTGLQERHVPNLGGYRGAASPEGLSLHYPVDLLRDPGSGEISGPVAL